MMTICYFGTYDPLFPRNRLILEGLRLNSVRIIECQESVWKNTKDKLAMIKGFYPKIQIAFRYLTAYTKLIYRYLKLENHDLVIVGYAGHFDMLLAKILTRYKQKILIFDAFLSIYDTAVNDRRVISQKTLLAKGCYHLDRTACQLASRVLLDTEAHIQYFHQLFRIPKDKFSKVPMGVFPPHQKSYFTEKEGESDLFSVTYIGTYIPLHGTEYIVKAADLLRKNQSIIFKMIGQGQDYAKAVELTRMLQLSNIQFYPEDDRTCSHLMEADVFLGVFGKTEKAKRIIPTKVFIGLSLGKAVITGDSAAAREDFTDRQHVLFCNMSDPESLANAIHLLWSDRILRNRIAENGYSLFQQKFTPLKIGHRVKTLLEEIITSKL